MLPDFLNLTSLTISLLIIIALYVLYRLIVYPYAKLEFYRKQGVFVNYSPFYGNMTSWVRDIKDKGDFLARWKSWGNMEPKPKAIAVNFGSSIRLTICDTKYIKDFIDSNKYHTRDPIVTKALRLLIGQAFSLNDGERWKRQRKFFSVGFHFEFLKSKVPLIVNQTNKFLDEIEKNPQMMNQINLKREVQILLGLIIGRTFIGEEFSNLTLKGKPIVPFVADLVAKVGTLLTDPLYHLFGAGFVKLGLTKRYKEIVDDTRDFRDFFIGMVHEKTAKFGPEIMEKSPGDGNSSMLELFHRQRIMNPKDAISDPEIIDQFLSFHTGGLESTSGVTTMMTYYLLKNPQYKDRLFKEIDEHFKGNGEELTLEKLNKMEFLHAMAKETLRMASPILSVMPRVANQDHMIGDIKVKQGTVVNVYFAFNNFSESIHEDATAFNPERWLPGGKTAEKQRSDPFSFTPFGLGGRVCIGQNFALMEVRIIFALFLKRFRYQLTDKDYKLVFTQNLAYEPETPIVYKLEKK